MNNFYHPAPAYSAPLVISSPELPSLRRLYTRFWNAWEARTDAHEIGTANHLQEIDAKFAAYGKFRSKYNENVGAFNSAIHFFLRNEGELPMGGEATIKLHRDAYNDAFVASEKLLQETASLNWTDKDVNFHKSVTLSLDSISRKNTELRDNCNEIVRRSQLAALNRQQRVGEAQAVHPRLPPPYTASFFGMPPSMLNSMAPGGVPSARGGSLPRGNGSLPRGDVPRRHGFPS